MLFAIGPRFESYGQSLFYAYHTKVAQTATDYVGKYADLIIVMGEGKQLEFTRQTNYAPLWRVFDKSCNVDEFFQNEHLIIPLNIVL